MNSQPTHRLLQSIASARAPLSVDLVGVGGSGSLMLSALARMHTALVALGHPGLNVTAYDPDTVSAANIGRQLFYPSDIGHNKAVVLTHRINIAFGLNWTAQPSFYSAEWFTSHARGPQLLITCVDSAASRVLIGNHWLHVHSAQESYWLDLGNRATDGQVVLGSIAASGEQPRLPCVLDLYPELKTSNFRDDDTPSCSLAEALEKQDLFVNQFVVTEAAQLLWQLLRHGEIQWHAVMINLRPRSTARKAVPAPANSRGKAKKKGAVK